MFEAVVGIGVKWLIGAFGCQDKPNLSIDPNILKAIDKAARLWGEGHPDVIELRFLYSGSEHGEHESYVDRIRQTGSCCNKCDHYARKAQERVDMIEAIVVPLLDSPQAGILGVKAGIVSTFTNPIYLIPICILVAVLLIFALRR